MQRIVIQGGRGGPASYWLVPLAFGSLLILTGIAVAVMPELLVAMVAALFLLAGLAMVGLALRLRAATRGGGGPFGGFPGGFTAGGPSGGPGGDPS